MVNSPRCVVTGFLFMLLLSADVSATSVVSDYCKKNSCVETAVGAIASAFKGMEIYLSPDEINAYNCRKSDFLNLTVVSPLLSADSKISVNGDPVCEIKGSLLPKTETCVFSLEGGAGGSTGYDNLIINVAAKSDAGLLSGKKELSKNFGVRMNHLVSDEEKPVLAAVKSAEVSLAAAYSKIIGYENSGYNMTSPRNFLNNSENKLSEAAENLAGCRFADASAGYKSAKRMADAAAIDASDAKKGQDGKKFSMITGKFLSTAANPVFGIMLMLILVLGYKLRKAKGNKGAKLDL
ncbi:MAG: hypothetical protein HY516_03955 [Candidatus Aenigmarchaeota archaeon]|nr:hypothetical protein [Candidatus Aenigmarchaeota archaeon]